MSAFVLGLNEVDRTFISLVGGKGANLGELSRIRSIQVPPGFCVTTHAFKQAMHSARGINPLLETMALLKPTDHDGIRALGARIRGLIQAAGVDNDIQAAIHHAVDMLGADAAYAVRSSATAEDLRSASFAGQQDTSLNVLGKPAIVAHVGRCWASLFTDRAIAYRLQHGIDHRRVHMGVVVQKMVAADAAGTLFTADPLSGNRKVSSVEACVGLGEALVSGLVNADGYRVRNGQLMEKRIATKRLFTRAQEEGGTTRQPLEEARQHAPVLTDEQVLRLEGMGRDLERHFGQPQDVEWCLADNAFFMVQSRPITTLFPVPDAGEGKHVFISVGHQQMMTDAMKPLGLSLWQLTSSRPMFAAGGRLFVDIARELGTSAGRAMFLEPRGGFDPLTTDALATLVKRGDFLDAPAAGPTPSASPQAKAPGPPVEPDPSLVSDLIAQNERAVDELGRTLRRTSGTERVDAIIQNAQSLRSTNLDGKTMGAILAFMNAAKWINAQMLAWLGEKGAADALAQSVPGNVTSEMGLALLDVADVIRPWAQVVAYLQKATDKGFLEGLLPLEGGRIAHDAISAYLDRYGMRCAGEIDIARTRWSECPTLLVPLLLGHVRNFAPGEAARKFEQGKQAAARKEEELLKRLLQLPDGEQKAAETQRMIRQLRNFAGYREHPKYGIVQRYFLYKQALLEEAAHLVQAGVLGAAEDIFFLTLPEVREVVRSHTLDPALLPSRKAEHERNTRLFPPRVMTSDGEILAGAYSREGMPGQALPGLAVSSGVAEGRARVLLDMAHASLEEGDILVTSSTDPSWTPLFVSIKGLVTEVGGLMTHGAVIAREYGLPAVVGVENATRLIRDGQRIRVHGTDGYVEVLSAPERTHITTHA